MIRIILALLFVILFLILGIPVLIVEWIIGKFNKQASDISSLRIVQWAFRVILFLCGTKVTVIGEENVPTDKAVLYICNHRSYFDIVITYSRCKRLTGYISKDNIAKVPLLNIWMKRLYCLFLNRTDMKEGLKTILTGIEQLNNGISMCIFPEGTRNRSTDQMDMLPFKAGSFKMAEKSGCPVVPMAITNSSDILEDHFPFVHRAHVILQYGKPILPNELSKEDKKKLSSLVQAEVRTMLVDNQKYL
jgi:1-acyl-sn-glycerol-3-phosphate acyltransferase